MTPRKRTTEEYIVLTLAGAITLAVLPFIVIRLVNQDWTLAALDMAIVIVSGGVFCYIMITGNLRITGTNSHTAIATSIIALTIAFLTIYIEGKDQFFWIYPVLVITFFLVPPRSAAWFSSLFLLCLFPIVLTQSSPMLAVTIYISVMVTVVATYTFSQRMRNQQEQLLALTTIDPLTGASNRRAMADKLTEIIALQRRKPTPVSMIMLDADSFKQINDEYGHAVGDQILIQLTQTFNLRIRATDKLYRFGGEEFIILAENTSLDDVVNLAEELRYSAQNSDKLNAYKLTISLGCAQYKPGETSDEWISRADKAVYRAKDEGRNRTCIG